MESNISARTRIAAELNPTAPEKVAIEAARIFSRRFDEYLNSGASVLVELTLSGLTLKKFLRATKDKGFQIKIWFLYLDSVEICLWRIAARVAKGGYHIPPEDVRRRYGRSNLEHVARRVKNSRAVFKQANPNAGDFKIENLAKIEIELADLENAGGESEQLETACRIEENVKAVVESLREQLNNYTDYSTGEREQIKHSATAGEENLQTRENEKRTAENNLNRQNQILSELRIQITKSETALETKTEVFGDLETRAKTAQQKTENARKHISSIDAEMDFVPYETGTLADQFTDDFLQTSHAP